MMRSSLDPKFSQRNANLSTLAFLSVRVLLIYGSLGT